MDTLSKICRACKEPLPLSDFYKRKNSDSYVSECKACMKLRSKNQSNTGKDYLVPRATTEITAIDYLKSKGIPAVPGKALHHSHVDVVAFGCVEIEVKYASLKFQRSIEKFCFSASPSQQENGFRAQVVMLICDYKNGMMSYHFFDAKHPVFYMKGRMKTGFTFTPGMYEAKKHGSNRLVMVQGMMDEAQDNVALIYEQLKLTSQALKGA